MALPAAVEASDWRVLMESAETLSLPAAVSPHEYFHQITGPTPEIRNERAEAFSFLEALEAKMKWSEAERWRGISIWQRSPFGTWRTKNVSPSAFVHKNAKLSPRLEFLYFAAHYLVPATRAEARFLRCSYIAQSAYVDEVLRAFAPAFVPASAEWAPICEQFERWAAFERLRAVEIVLVAPTATNPGSLFGHTFLRLDYDGPSKAIAVLAETEKPFREDPFYPIKGIFGGYYAYVHDRPFLSFLYDYTAKEQRSLKRWRLRLTPRERMDLLRHVWTLRNHGAFRYYFFSDNCAGLTVDLLNSVLPSERKIDFPRLLAVGPTGTVEGMAFTQSADGRSLLEPQGMLNESMLAEAVAAERRRSQYTRENPRFGAIHSEDPEHRLKAYALLATADSGGVRQQVLTDSVLVESLLNTVMVQRAEYAAEQWRLTELRKVRTRLREELGRGCPEGESLVKQIDSGVRAERLRAYGSSIPCVESASQFFVYSRVSASLFEDVPPEGACAACFRESRVDPSLLEYQTGKSVLPTLPALSTWVTSPAQEPLPPPRGSRHTGIDGTYIGVGAWKPLGPARSFSRILWGGAILDERLGDQRLYGFPANSEMTFLRSSVEIQTGSTGVRVPEATTRVFGFRSLRDKFDELGDYAGVWGWEVFTEAGRSDGKEIAVNTRLGGGILIAMENDPVWQRYGVLRLGVRYEAAYPQKSSGSFQTLGAILGIESRVPVAFLAANDAVRFGVTAEPFWDAYSGMWGKSVSAQLEGRVSIAEDDTILWRKHVGSYVFVLVDGEHTALRFNPETTILRARVGVGFE